MDQRNPISISDGSGGTIVAWIDSSGGVTSGLRAQRVSASGAPLWGANGLAVYAGDGNLDTPSIAPDGGGGAIIAWTDFRTGTTAGDLYAQRINAAGVPQWTVDGAVVSNATNGQRFSVIVSDGVGGAILVWQDSRNFKPQIFAQRIDAAGTSQWPGDVQVFAGCADCQALLPVTVSDGAGGVIVAWGLYHSGDPFNLDINAQRLNAAGVPQWAEDGISVCNAPSIQTQVGITTDGAGGAIMAWIDTRNGITESGIYAQRVSDTGLTRWTPNGVALRSIGDTPQYPALVSDGAGGAIVAWEDNRSGPYDIYGQRVNGSGVPQWTPNGVAVCAAVGDQFGPHVVPDGTGGAIVCWQDVRGIDSDVYAQRVTFVGAAAWTPDGIPVSTAIGDQLAPTIVPDGAGGAILAWMDDRSGTNFDIYAQRIERGGQLGRPEPIIASVRDVPNDQGGRVKVAWLASYLDAAGSPKPIGDYRVWRSAPPNSIPAQAFSGTHGVAPGRVMAAGDRFLRIVSAAGDVGFWEYLVSLPAAQLPSYSYVAPTTGDMVDGSNPYTLFMIEAQALDGSHWFSAPDSGYSIDNLPPLAPGAFTAKYIHGDIVLLWAHSPEADFAKYRIYRGPNAAFVPGPANRVAEQSDIGYVEHQLPDHWYKLSATDSHGNEGPFAQLGPSDILGAPGEGEPGTLWLSSPRPNPMSDDATFAFGVPTSARVVLAIYDLEGRRVRILVDETVPAGEHPVFWDGTSDRGVRVPGGLYLYRLDALGRRLTGRLVTVR